MVVNFIRIIYFKTKKENILNNPIYSQNGVTIVSRNVNRAILLYQTCQHDAGKSRIIGLSEIWNVRSCRILSYSTMSQHVRQHLSESYNVLQMEITGATLIALNVSSCRKSENIPICVSLHIYHKEINLKLKLQVHKLLQSMLYCFNN